jgi:hypothetical protein
MCRRIEMITGPVRKRARRPAGTHLVAVELRG